MQRAKLSKSKKTSDGGDYFKESKLEFIKSGCVLLDCVLGGGWPLGRVSNIVGDKAVGKTLLAIEACANFARQHPEGHIWYREAEAAFDEDYAETLGLPVKRVDFGEEGIGTIWNTVDDIAEDLDACIKTAEETGQPGLYIVDSLDALSSRAEMGRAMDEGTYGLEKQKMVGQMFRRYIRGLKQHRVALIIISQVRDKIGVSFGDKHSRSGGKALDFYASIALWLALKKTLKKSYKGIERPVGIKVIAKCKKNKISMPHRECDFDIRYGYGIEELDAAVDWLKLAGWDKELPGATNAKALIEAARKMDDEEYAATLRAVRKLTRRAWRTIEAGFVPQRRKYV